VGPAERFHSPAAWRFDYVRSDVIASGRILWNCQRPQIDLYHRRRIGMGRETARLFREKGWFIGGYDVNADGLRALEKELAPTTASCAGSTSPTRPTTKKRSPNSALRPVQDGHPV